MLIKFLTGLSISLFVVILGLVFYILVSKKRQLNKMIDDVNELIRQGFETMANELTVYTDRVDKSAYKVELASKEIVSEMAVLKKSKLSKLLKIAEEDGFVEKESLKDIDKEDK